MFQSALRRSGFFEAATCDLKTAVAVDNREYCGHLFGYAALTSDADLSGKMELGKNPTHSYRNPTVFRVARPASPTIVGNGAVP